MTSAQSELSKDRKRHPPIYATVRGADRAQQLYQLLAPVLPDKLRALVSNGNVAIGEIGRYRPDIQTIPVDAHNSIVELTSGMMDFVYAVVRTLAGSAVHVTTSGKENEPATTVTEVAHDTALLFEQWKWPRRWVWAFRRITYPKFEITQNVQGWTEKVTRHVEMFLLAHELGHVAIHHGLLPASPVNQELRADTVGCGIMFDLAKSHQIDPTEVYGAAVLALRICAGLEHIGVRFSGAYPEHEEERLGSLREEVISQCCPSMQYFHEISRIAVAYEDQMDDVESHLCKTSRSPDSERILVLLIAELLDVAQGRLELKEFSERLLALSGQTPSEILKSSFRMLYKYYVAAPPAHSFIDPYMRQRMGSVLVETTKHLPTQIAGLFGN